MKYLGMMHYFLGLEVCTNTYDIFIIQGKYVVEIPKRFQMMDCKAISTMMASNLKLLCDTTLETVDAIVYKRMIGSLIYLKNTRSDICFVVNTLSQYIAESRRVHLIVANHVLRYLTQYD